MEKGVYPANNIFSYEEKQWALFDRRAYIYICKTCKQSILQRNE